MGLTSTFYPFDSCSKQVLIAHFQIVIKGESKSYTITLGGIPVREELDLGHRLSEVEWPVTFLAASFFPVSLLASPFAAGWTVNKYPNLS